MKIMKQKRNTVPVEGSAKNKSKDFLIYYVLIFIITVSAVVGFGILTKKTEAELLRDAVMSMFVCCSLIFVMSKIKLEGEYAYDNEEHPLRFFVVYLIGLAMSFIFPFIPVTGWPFMAISVAIALFSNWLIGITVSSFFIMISVTIAGANANVFMLYFTVGFVGILLFHNINEDFSVGIPFGISLLNLLVVETACTIIFINENLSLEMFVIPIINLFVTSVLLAIFLKYFSARVLHRTQNVYMEINDQEFALMVELKNFSKEDYYNAIHTTYFCGLIAKKIEVDDNILKAGGYYHRIYKLKDENPFLVIEELGTSYRFPLKVQELLKELLDTNNGIRSKETAIVYFSDAIISSIVYLFQKNPNADINYEQLVNTIFEKKLSSGIFQACELSLKELSTMKNIFMEEKLYYDFLR